MQRGRFIECGMISWLAKCCDESCSPPDHPMLLRVAKKISTHSHGSNLEMCYKHSVLVM